MGGSCRCMRERRGRNERSRSAADPARTKLDAVSSCADADGDDLSDRGHHEPDEPEAAGLSAEHAAVLLYRRGGIAL